MDTQYSLTPSLIQVLAFITLLWVIRLLDVGLDLGLYRLGVYPGDPAHLLGIMTAPLIHGSWSHLVNNTLSILVLGTLFVYGYPRSRWKTLAIIWVLSGIGVWLFARPSYHFGASGLTHGFLFFLLVAGLLRRDKRSLVLMMSAFFLYGGMLLTILPREQGISFESHLFGALPAVLCAWLFRHDDPKYQRRVYDWEQEVDEEKDWPPEDGVDEASNGNGAETEASHRLH